MINKKDIILIIPVYNEEHTIGELVEKSKQYADVCVVDDSSRDTTKKILSAIDGIHVIYHETNTNITKAILDGMRYAVEQEYKYCITMDAGFSHNPDEIPLFISKSHADLVIGVRTKKTNTPLYRKCISYAGNFIYNITLDFPGSITKQHYYRDITSGFRRYSNKAMKLLLSKRMRSRSFDFLFESMMIVYRNRLSISETPISYNYSNSSLNLKALGACFTLCLKSLFNNSRIYHVEK